MSRVNLKDGLIWFRWIQWQLRPRRTAVTFWKLLGCLIRFRIQKEGGVRESVERWLRWAWASAITVPYYLCNIRLGLCFSNFHSIPHFLVNSLIQFDDECHGHRRNICCTTFLDVRIISLAVREFLKIFLNKKLVAKKALTISHPLPILNISEHLTRLKLQKNSLDPFGPVQSI